VNVGGRFGNHAKTSRPVANRGDLRRRLARAHRLPSFSGCGFELCVGDEPDGWGLNGHLSEQLGPLAKKLSPD
jgi:hypothetical protein